MYPARAIESTGAGARPRVCGPDGVRATSSCCWDPNNNTNTSNRLVMGDKLPREIENLVYRYLIAISKLRVRLGILTEQGEGS